MVFVFLKASLIQHRADLGNREDREDKGGQGWTRVDKGGHEGRHQALN